jgi:hypothetical protein
VASANRSLLIKEKRQLLGVAAGMKARDNGYGVRLDAKKQVVGKAMQKSAANVVQHDRELQGVIRDALHGQVKLGAKSNAKAGGLRFVPVLCVDDFQPRGLSENDG